MTMLRVITSRLKALFVDARSDAELDEDIQAHLELLAEEHLRQGLSPEDARAAARRDFGGVEQMKEAYRDQRGVPMLESLLQDLRHSGRALRRSPGSTLVATVTIALGIFGPTVTFTMAKAWILEPLPFARPDELVDLRGLELRSGAASGRRRLNAADFLEWQRSAQSFEMMAGYRPAEARWTGPDGAEHLRGALVTPGFFRLLGVEARWGRLFEPTEVGREHLHLVVISHLMWRERLHGDPAAVGATLRLDGEDHTVIGVLPEAFQFTLLGRCDVWRPLLFTPEEAVDRSGLAMVGLARLRRGRTVEEARHELTQMAAASASAYPDTNGRRGVRVLSLADEIRVHHDLGFIVPVMFAMVTCVLLIACFNTTNVMLARASTRRQEMAVRLALGAGRRRLVGQLLTESLLLGLLGGAAGLIVAEGALRAILAAEPQGLPRLAEVALSGRVLAFSAALSVLTGILFGLVPALEASRTPVAGTLQESGRGAPGGPRARQARRFLIVSEVALALVLLTGAGLLIRSFLRVMAVDPGFDPRDLAVMRISLDHATYRTAAQSREFYRALTRRLEALPGVLGVAGVTALPLSPVGTDFSRPYWREGEPDPGGTAAKTDIRMVTPGYFATMRMALLRGRGFTADDGPDRPRIIVVNETLAQREFPGRDPVGQRLVIDYRGGAYPYEIVGVVGNTRFRGLKAEPRPELFIPHAQNPYLDLSLVVRTSAEPAAMFRTVQREIAILDPLQPAYGLVTMDDLVRRSVSADRFATVLLALLAGLALALAATGIYGVLSFLVAQRTHEIGLRMALGATGRAVVRMVMGESLRLTLAGSAIGLLVSLALARPAAHLLYGVPPDDPVTFGGVVVLMAGVALVAALLPARRASRLDPMVALRQE